MYALAQLDAALVVGQRELKAYADNDPESVFPLVEERESLVLSALSAMAEVEAVEQRILLDKLQMVMDQQRELACAARRLRDEVMDSLNASKPQAKRLVGYSKAARPAIIPFAFAKS